MKLLVVGNCQFRTVSDVLKLCIPNATVQAYRVDDKRLDNEDIDTFDYILSHRFSERYGDFSEKALAARNNVKFIPYIVYSGFHPDCIYHVKDEQGKFLPSPVNKNAYHSLIVACSFIRGLSPDETLGLFNKKFYDFLSYYAYSDVADNTLKKELEASNMPGQYLLDKWKSNGRFMYTVNHCKAHVLADIGIYLAHQIQPNLEYVNIKESEYLEDYMALDADFYSIYEDKRSAVLKRSHEKAIDGVRTLNLKMFINESFDIYKSVEGQIFVEQKYLERFDEAYRKFSDKSLHCVSPNPYRSIGRKQFWRKSVSNNIDMVDLSINPKFEINRKTKVATAGSCFAQHIARSLHNSGFTYYIAEPPPAEMGDELAQERSYGLFSARYGNIYTVKQLVQLFERAYGLFVPQDTAWKTPKGFVDPIRPNLGEYFGSIEDVIASTSEHLAAVRQQFENLNVFVFTLGLTEAWENIEDGTVYPVCPYAITEQMSDKYQFANHDYIQVKADLDKFLYYLNLVNPEAKVLLTVSPVPLIATYENQHVLMSTTESKAVLRSVAGKAAKQYSHVEYFPSYEIITGSYNQGSFFEENLREVKKIGVSKVMETFYRSFEKTKSGNAKGAEHHLQDSFIDSEISKVSDVVCDEELLDK